MPSIDPYMGLSESLMYCLQRISSLFHVDIEDMGQIDDLKGEVESL